MCLLNNDKKPHIYTSGTKDSFDVNFARGICKNFNLSFTHYDTELEQHLSVMITKVLCLISLFIQMECLTTVYFHHL